MAYTSKFTNSAISCKLGHDHSRTVTRKQAEKRFKLDGYQLTEDGLWTKEESMRLYQWPQLASKLKLTLNLDAQFMAAREFAAADQRYGSMMLYVTVDCYGAPIGCSGDYWIQSHLLEDVTFADAAVIGIGAWDNQAAGQRTTDSHVPDWQYSKQEAWWPKAVRNISGMRVAAAQGADIVMGATKHIASKYGSRNSFTFAADAKYGTVDEKFSSVHSTVNDMKADGEAVSTLHDLYFELVGILNYANGLESVGGK